MASSPAPKSRQEVVAPTQGGKRLTPIERAIERSDIKVDLAACIRNTFGGIAVVILALGVVLYPEMVSIPEAAQALARIFTR